MHPITPSTVFNLPTLPTELIEEILQVEILSKSDLARCCLVSKQFLPTSRQRLYNHLELLFYRQRYEPVTLAAIVLPVRQSLDLYHILHRNASLCRLSTTLSFKLTSPEQGTRFWPPHSFREWIETFLVMFPNLKCFMLDHWVSTRDEYVPRSILQKQDIVGLGLCQLTYDQLAIISKLPNLKTLRFVAIVPEGNTASSSHLHRSILPNLRTLATCKAENGLPSSLSHTLKVLRIDLDLHFIEFSLTPELTNLYLEVQTYTGGVRWSPDLSPLLRLQYLHLGSNWENHKGEKGYSNLYKVTKSLPPQPFVLAVTSFVSSTALARRLNLEVPIPIRELRLSPFQDSHADHSGLEVLYTTCAKKNIKLSFDLEEKDPDIFGL